MIFECSSLNPGQFVTYESLSDRKLENFESKNFETLSSNQFSKINITRECSIWKHSRHLQIPVIIGHTSAPVPCAMAKSLVISLSMEGIGHVQIVYFKLAYFALESTWKYFLKINLEPVESLGICWISFSKPRWLQFNLCKDYSLKLISLIGAERTVTDAIISLMIRPQLISMKISQMRLNSKSINVWGVIFTAEVMIQNQPTRSTKSCLRFRARQSNFFILEWSNYCGIKSN